MRTPAVAQQLFGTLGLPSRLDLPAALSMGTEGGVAGGLPACPFAAPFTPLAPAVVRLVSAWVHGRMGLIGLKVSGLSSLSLPIFFQEPVGLWAPGV